MTNEFFFRKETYREVKSGNLVVVVTGRHGNCLSYVTRVLWNTDPEDDAEFESATEEEAMRRHEKLSGSFRKYAMVWKLVNTEIQLPYASQDHVAVVA